MSMALVMSQMPDVWRKVLAEHVPDQSQRCRECRDTAGQQASWPCQTYRVAQEAKWVSEGNLPGTGPHGPGPSASPRVSPPSEGFRSPSAASRPTGSWERDPLGSPSYASGSYGSGPSASGSYSGGSYSDGSYGNGSSGAGSYGSGSYGADALGSDPYGSGSYGSNPYGSNSYSVGSHGPGSHGSGSHRSDSTGQGAYGQDPYGSSPYGSGGYGSGGYGSSFGASDPYAPPADVRPGEGRRAESSSPYGSTHDAPYGASFGVDDRPSWR